MYKAHYTDTEIIYRDLSFKTTYYTAIVWFVNSVAHLTFMVVQKNMYKEVLKKMFNQDEGKIECAVGNREICVWQGKKAEIVLILFLTSGFVAFICLWHLVLPNSNNLINHVLY